MTRSSGKFLLAGFFLLSLVRQSAGAETLWWRGTENDSVTNLSCYSTTRSGSMKIPAALPAPGDIVGVVDNGCYRVTDDTAAFVGALDKILPRTGARVIFDIAEDHVFGCGVHQWRTATFIKRGKGVARMTADREIDAQNRHIDYCEPIRVEEGSVVLPQENTVRDEQYSLSSVSVAEGASLILPNAKRINMTDGISGGGHIHYANEEESASLYCGGKEDTPPFTGVLSGNLELRPSNGYVTMLTEANTFSQGVYLSGNSTFATRRFGGETGQPSAFGASTEHTTVNGTNVTFLCLATEADGPQTCSRQMRDWCSLDGTWTFDAGAYGGVTFSGGPWRVTFGKTTPRMRELVLTGSNTAECVVSVGVTCGDDYDGHYYLTKRGSGVWRMSTTKEGDRRRIAGIGVEEGTLRFDSLRDRGKTCSLGTATNLFGYAYQGSMAAAPKEVDYAIRLGTATNLAAEGTLEYTGDTDVSVTTRQIAVTGCGRLRNATAKHLSLAGLKSVVPPESGIAPASAAIVLDGDDVSATNVLRDIFEDPGAAPLSVAKEGAGGWTLSGRVSFTGALAVREGTLKIVAEDGASVLPQGVASLEVAVGAALRCEGTSPVVRKLVVDASTGVGAVADCTFADKGRIVLRNTQDARDVTFAWETDGCTGLANLSNWTVETTTDDGFGYDVTADGTALRIRRRCVTLTAENVEVYANSKVSAAYSAAMELTNHLAKAFGVSVPLVKKLTSGKVALIVGSNTYSLAEGLYDRPLPRDGFVIRAVPPDRIYIAGEDNPRSYSPYASISTSAASLKYHHASLFGVYGFLERFVDARFYFPGDQGTLLPRKRFIDVPVGTFEEVPDDLFRSYSTSQSDAAGYEKEMTSRALWNWMWMLTRMETINIPCCHGTNKFKYLERFRDTHPEYFAMKEDGSRWTNAVPGNSHSTDGHLCWSSAITNEIFLDVRSYLLGEDASVRGIPGNTEGTYAWGRNCADNGVEGRFVDIMPNDGYTECKCSACQKAYKRMREQGKGDQYASDLIWRVTAGVAQRLQDEGIPGNITQMCYSPYRVVPDFDLPTNVHVMVAERGAYSKYNPEAAAKQKAEIIAWTEKLGHKVWLWNYYGKLKALDIPEVPCVCPHAWGEYYKEMSPWIRGAYAESETDRFFFNQLNYYVFGKVCWNNATDVDAIIREYHSRMFGAAASESEAFFDALEDIWLKEVVSRCVDTDEGPVTRPPDERAIWTEVYTTNRIAAWAALLDAGAAKLAEDTPERERFELMRSQLLTPLAQTCAAYVRNMSVERELARRARRTWEEKYNIIADGDFCTVPKSSSRFCGEWSAAQAPFPRETSTYVTGDGCVVVTGGTAAVNINQYLTGRLKPSTRYRLSFFLKLDDVQCEGSSGGAGVTFYDAYNHQFPPYMSYTGTADWAHYSFEFTTDAHPIAKPYIRLRMSANCRGTAYFDGVRLTELVKQGACLFVR